VGKPEGKGQLGRPRCRWENSIKIDLTKDNTAWTGFKWLRL
jgi:hypothetical protein